MNKHDIINEIIHDTWPLPCIDIGINSYEDKKSFLFVRIKVDVSSISFPVTSKPRTYHGHVLIHYDNPEECIVRFKESENIENIPFELKMIIQDHLQYRMKRRKFVDWFKEDFQNE